MKYSDIEKKQNKKENNKKEEIRERNKALIAGYRTVLAFNLGIIAVDIINQDIKTIAIVLLSLSSIIALVNIFDVSKRRKFFTVPDIIMLFCTISTIYITILWSKF